MGVFYGVGVTFDELFHLPQMSLLDFLKLLLKHTDKDGETRKVFALRLQNPRVGFEI